MLSVAASSPENRALSSVFIGNIPHDIGEELLKALFSEIGAVINFQVFFDKSNKSKVAFCEFKDPGTAIRAVRSLNGSEFKGQTMHVDLATSEKSRQELERLQASVETSLDSTDTSTDKAPEEISKAVASLPAEQMFELMKQMKMCIENNPQEARNLLLQNPQLAYALLQAQVIMRIVDPTVAIKILSRPVATPAGLNTESKNEPAQAAPPMTEAPPAQYSAGMPTVANDPMAVNMPSAVSHPGVGPVPVSAQGGISVPGPVPPVRPSGVPMLPGPANVSGVSNQFADQDLRALGDQDLRTLPNIGDRDMRAPPVMLDKDMRQPMGDQDFRTLGIPTAIPESRPFDPRFRNMQGPERSTISGFDRPRPAAVDPRTAYDPRNAGGPSRVEDPRKASAAAATLNSRLTAAGNALQDLNPNMPHSAMGSAGMIPDEQEKAALIMQVLQLTDQQIAALPPEQRQSIMVLKEQLARSHMIQ